MFTDLIESSYSFCSHGWKYYDCSICNTEDDMDIDKCLNCGRYKKSTSLNSDQCCKQGCINPNED